MRISDWSSDVCSSDLAETDRFLALLEGVLPEVSWLDDAATLTYLHGTVSGVRHPVTVPSVPMHLAAWLADTPLAGGAGPKPGDADLRAPTVRGFPGGTGLGLRCGAIGNATGRKEISR